MGFFDKFKRISFDEAVNMVLSNNINPADDKKVLAALIGGGLIRLQFINAVRIYFRCLESQLSKEEIERRTFDLVESGLGYLLNDTTVQDTDFANRILQNDCAEGFNLGKMCFQYCNDNISGEENATEFGIYIYLVYAYANGIGTKKDIAKAREALEKLRRLPVDGKVNAASFQSTCQALEQML